MTFKQFSTIKIITAIILAGVVSYSVTINNFLIPLLAVTLAWVILFWARGRVKGVVADERDYEIGGHAARWSIQIFSWTAVVVMFALFYWKSINPVFEVVTYVLAYATCGLMLLYSLFFTYYNRFQLLGRRTIFFLFGAIVLAVFVTAGLRLFTGEDGWICQNGQWIEHGHPDSPIPTTVCKQ